MYAESQVLCPTSSIRASPTQHSWIDALLLGNNSHVIQPINGREGSSLFTNRDKACEICCGLAVEES